MKETRQILDAMAGHSAESGAVLATVVDVDGSSFRLPGAKMLILEDGKTIGTVSGGCLEADVLERAAEVRKTGEPSMLIYDTTNENDSVFSLNMGCRGIIRILMEPAWENAALRFHKDNLENARAGVVATQISGGQIGSQVIVDTKGVRHSSFTDPKSTQAVMVEADRVLAEGKSGLKTVLSREIFFEYVPIPTVLLIFGAGADAVPFAKIANEIGWKTRVIDHRAAYATRERFPMADAIASPKREKLVESQIVDRDAVAVVMTHNFETDKQVVGGLLRSAISYIGVMGPKSRTEKMLDEIESEGLTISEEMRLKVYGPVGLDIGATTPEGIALSIASEIQTFLSGRKGGFLRTREGSIYGRG